MTELADRLSRHADLHEHQPWADDEQMQFARDLREAVGLIAELARLRAQVPVGWIGPSGFTHNTATNRMWMRESPKLAAKLSPVYAAPPAQPAEQQAQTVCKRTLVEIDARLRECSIVGASAADAYDTFYQHMVETALAAQPAEPVQRLSDERAAFEAWHNEYRTQELVRRDDTYYNTHVRCRWEGWQARAIESALQPGWRDIESAPKDGTDVWLHADGKVLRAFWLVKPYRETRDLDGNYIDHQDYDEHWMSCPDGDEVEDPTEWQPLVTPLPPKATK